MIIVTDIVLAFCIQLIVLCWSLFWLSDLFSQMAHDVPACLQLIDDHIKQNCLLTGFPLQ